jgi:photosystem II stability/assembly factor-like uncharacterized protein
MNKRAKFFLLLVVGFFLFSPVAFAAYDWIETQPLGDMDGNWSGVASDADGSNLIVVDQNGGRVYISTNNGTSWTETQPNGDIFNPWSEDPASDADGSNLIVPGNNGRLYISTNGGSSWTETQPAGASDKFWRSVASDADGSTLMAAVGLGRLYLSTNGGSSWTDTQPAGNTDQYWWDVASDADGSNLFAAITAGRLYISTDGGSNWTETQPKGNTNGDWYTIASDADGSVLIAAENTGRVYVSTNGGSSWNETQPAGNVTRDWESVGMSGDGSVIVIAAYNGRMYISEDSGSSWEETRPSGDVNKGWRAVASNSDGSLLIVGQDGSPFTSARLYIGTPSDSTSPSISSLSPEDDATNVAVNTDLVISFDEDVATSTGNITIKKSSDDSTIETIDVGSSQISVSGNEMTLNLSSALLNGSTFYVQIDAGAIEDLAGNPFSGIADATTWNFTTIAAPVEEPEEGDDDTQDNGSNSSGHRRSGGGNGGDSESSIDTTGPTQLADVIMKLRALLAELETRGVTLPPGAAPYLLPAVTQGYTRDLTVGDRGTDVTKLQLYLIANNAGPAAQALATAGATGYFGPLTQAALAEFQSITGITPAMGYFGQKTKAYLQATRH